MIRSATSPRLERAARGVGIIEILVAIVITSIGLLGVAAMQLTGLRNETSSAFRTNAAQLANAIAERMRADKQAVDNNLFANIDTSTVDCTATLAAYCSNTYDGTKSVAGKADCSVSDMATFDVNVWACGGLTTTLVGGVQKQVRVGGIAHLLPSGRGTIICNDSDTTDADTCTDGSTHTITISWQEPLPNNGQGYTQATSLTNCGDVVGNIQLRCTTMIVTP